MKILKLESENIKRLKAIEITPEGNLVVVGGNNGEGKTSTLDSIAYALGGRALIPSEPINRDHEKAKVSVDVGEFKITRTFTKGGGGTLKVVNQDGAVYPSPQKMLDALVGKLTFDPLEFANMKPGDQLETLKSLTGLDFTEIENEKKQLYEERTVVNRDGKSLKARLDSMTKYDDAPEQEISVSVLMGQLNKAQETNRENQKKRAAVESLDSDIEKQKKDIVELKDKIAKLQEELRVRESELKGVESERDTTAKDLAKLVDADEETPRNQISNAEETNRKVRANAEYAETEKQLEQKRQESTDLTEKIKALDSKKSEQMAAAKFPVEGLSFDENGVLYNDFPFNQASDAERLRVSVGMGIAMNPKLKVLLVRNGSLLDDNNLKAIAEIAAQNDAQIWLERVGKGKECAVIIEDGEITK